MGRFLNVGIIQMSVSEDPNVNLHKIEESVEILMASFHKPELIIGVELGISLEDAEPIPGPLTDYLGKIAKKHGIYFIPGTMHESAPELGEGKFYNSAPVFNPQGDIITVYRKMCPWYPAEQAVPGKEYVVFDIPEKQTTIGIQICYDISFYEIARNTALMGSEIIINLAMDPEPLYLPYRATPIVRAVENQAYFIHTNAVGNSLGNSNYGHTMVVNPEAKILWEAEKEEAVCTITLDLDLVKMIREKGSLGMHPLLKDLKDFQLPMPFANNLKSAPVFQRLSPPACNMKEYQEKAERGGLGSLHTFKKLPNVK